MIATALSDETVVQVVDRRITKDGVLYDDLANKAICGVAADASFSIAYTGLMMAPTRTDEWIANFLASDNVLALRLPEILEKLASALTLEFDRLAGLSQIGGVAPRAESCRRPVRQALLVNRVVTDC